MKLPRHRLLRKHPLLLLIEHLGESKTTKDGEVDGRRSKLADGTSAVAAHLGIDRASVITYRARAVANRDALVPATWVIPLADLSGIHPWYWRSDLYQEDGLQGANEFSWGEMGICKREP